MACHFLGLILSIVEEPERRVCRLKASPKMKHSLKWSEYILAKIPSTARENLANSELLKQTGRSLSTALWTKVKAISPSTIHFGESIPLTSFDPLSPSLPLFHTLSWWGGGSVCLWMCDEKQSLVWVFENIISPTATTIGARTAPWDLSVPRNSPELNSQW